LKEYGFKKNKDEVENYLSKNYVPKDNDEEEMDEEKNSNKEINSNNIDDKKNDNNSETINNKRLTKKKSILSRNKLSVTYMNNNVKFEKNKTEGKILKGLKLKPEKKKNKFKLKELINNFSVSTLPKKKELLIPLKIKKSINLKKNETINELSNIEKPKNLKKFLFNTKQELSEADFQDFPFNLKKKEKEKNPKSPEKKNEGEDDELVKNLKAKNPINLKNIDFSAFIGPEKKISFMSPARGRNNLYRKSIYKKTKVIFDKI
jgi:hypothetical protein